MNDKPRNPQLFEQGQFTRHDADGNVIGTELRAFTDITLRDLLAGLALSGLLSDPSGDGSCDQVADLAYGFADAMLRAREAAK